MTDAARPPLPYSWPDVRSRLQASIYQLLPALGISEQPRGGTVTPKNPTRDDRHAGSFVIWVSGVPNPGGWREFAVPGDQGDIIDLVAYLLGLRARIDAYWWSLEFLGLDRGTVRSAEADQLARERARRDRAAAEAKANAEREAKSAALFAQWLALPEIGGTLAETYLREARGIPLERLHHIPRALRFAQALDHIDDDTGEITTWPCMVSAMTRGVKVVALHRTWLAPDGSGKAPVAKAKKMIGPPSGAAIRLTHGVANCSPAEAERRGKRGPLAIGEGIETSLTVACARPDYRVWAAGSLSLMGLLDWPPCASGVVLLRDNDWKPEAVKAFGVVERKWLEMSNGRQVLSIGAALGNDFNDMVRGAA